MWLARIHLALAEQVGARTLRREVDALLKRRPGLGALAADAGALRDQLSKERGSSVPGAPALTAAELRLLPLLSTYLSFPQIAEEMFLPPTRSSRRRCRSTASWGPAHAARLSPGPMSSASPRDDSRSSSHQGDGIRSGMRCHGVVTVGESSGQTVRFQEIVRRLAMIDEGFVEDQAGFGLDPAGPSGSGSQDRGAAAGKGVRGYQVPGGCRNGVPGGRGRRAAEDEIATCR